MAEVVWKPSPEVVERANVTRLMRRHDIDDYWELVRRSQEDLAWFWTAAVEDTGLEWATPWERVYDDSGGIEWTTWFVGGKVNVAWNCVHRWAERRPAAPGPRPAGGGGGGVLEVGGDVAGGARPRRRPRGARRRRGGRRRHLLAHVAGGGRRLARLRAPRRGPVPNLLRLRGACCG